MPDRLNHGGDSAAPCSPGNTRRQRAPQRINWVRHLHQWHWMTSAVCLVGLVLFAATGITLNNAQVFERAEPQIQRRTEKVPPEILQRLAQAAEKNADQLPREAGAWLQSGFGLNPSALRLDWTSGELGISAPRPGGSASLRIDLSSGTAEFERTDRGLIAYFNDLHKGRHAGPAWSWFIDLFAVAALISALTGLLILVRQSKLRPSIWPLVTLGIVVPSVVIFMFVH